MTTDTRSTIAALETAAAAVAGTRDACFAAREAALIAEREAEANVLDLAVVAVKPVLSALCRPIIERYWCAGLATDGQRSGATYHAARGLLVDGLCAGRDAPRDNEGSYEGVGLYLLDDGTFAAVKWTGNWSRWQGTEEVLNGEMVALASPLDVLVAGWNLDEILAELSCAAYVRAGKLRALEAVDK